MHNMEQSYGATFFKYGRDAELDANNLNRNSVGLDSKRRLMLSFNI